MTDGEVREEVIQMAQSIPTHDQTITAQANWEVVTWENQHASTMATNLRDFTRMNPPMFFRSNVDENPRLPWWVPDNESSMMKHNTFIYY